MAVPVSEAALAQPAPARRAPDPRAPGWAGAQRAMVAAAEANALAVRELAARPHDGAALEMARLSISVLESLGDCLLGLSIPEAVMAEERRRAYEDGVAACKAARRRLGVVPGPPD